MIRNVYIDTSVFGGYFDKEFDNDTRRFFDKIFEEKITIIVSETTFNELKNAPNNVKEFYESIPKNIIKYVNSTDEVEELANKYIEAKIVGKSSIEDCQHIAFATIFNAEVLVSWNFKHILNLERKRGYNAINLLNGYKSIEIINPKEVFNYAT